MKFKELKKQNRDLVDLVNNQKLAFDKMVTHYENQLKQQDRELARRLTIINYLETKALKVFEW